MAGFWERILRHTPPVAYFTPRVEYIGGGALEPIAEQIGFDGTTVNASVAKLWRTQPHLRTTVSFLARNVAQLGVHVFERVNETDRRRDRDSLAARVLAFPDVDRTIYDLVYALVGDMLLYDRAYWWIAPSIQLKSGWMVRRMPPSWVTPQKKDLFTVDSYLIQRGDNVAEVPAQNILDFTGYSPTNPIAGSPTVDSLRDTLQEQVQAALYRKQVWKRGGRVSAVLERPKDAPQWSDDARERFRDDWYGKYTGTGPQAGGTPILEDGMTLNRIDFTAQEQQFVEAAKLSLTTVAAAFHVNPTMIGVLDNANYSNVREFRRMLYGDTLGPLLSQIEARLNTFLLEMLDTDPERFYVEFNIGEKLQGSFEEQTQAMQASVGRPWMTADEARARLNLPALGGDAEQLVTPLNVLVGGQASPVDAGSQNRNSRRVQLKAAPSDPQRDRAAQVLADFFGRQEKAVRSRMGAKAADWWDGDRWNRELADEIYQLAVMVSSDLGPETAEKLGFTRDDYDVDRTLAFLRKVADRRAELVNQATLDQLEAALTAEDPSAAVDTAWTTAKEQRSGAAAAAIVAMAAGFATLEAARQTVGEDGAVKTWNTGTNPRPTHAAMDGETVPVGDAFSNGQMWPGESTDPDETAGCNCSCEVTIPGGN